MKRLILYLSFLLCVPCVAPAADHCTNPDKYTIDKRCYVTDEQKKEKPYNAVVGVYETDYYDYICCTGTIVNQDDELYVYTARHCVNKSDGSIEPSMWIKFQNDKENDIKFVVAGDDSDNGDWAVYRLSLNYVTENLFNKAKHQANENMKDTIDYVYVQNNNAHEDLTAVGYGSLKIMSDTDIENFRQAYLDYLKQQGVTLTKENVYEYGLDNFDDGIAVSRNYVQQFINNNDGLGALFDDERLKFSNCFGALDCHGWSGNSGGPLFDKTNRLVGIQSRGYSIIGGVDHAKSTKYVPAIYVSEGIKKLKENSNQK
jgi:V8-like Glu-specific endopeptidase